MERTTLAHILDATDGITGGKDGYRIGEDHRVSFYLGQAGQAMEISDIDRCELHEGYLAVHRRDHKGVLFAEYGAIYAVACRAMREGESRRTGFA
jgi:hypothetical protein